MKKRLISIALMLVVLVSCLGLTACQVPQPEGNEVDSINGMDPVAAYEAAVDALDLTRFRVESSMGISLSLWVFPILDYSIPMMVCDTDGENVHQWITEEYFAVTEALGIEEEIFDELEQEGLELYEEMIYYNGVFYCRNGEELSRRRW